MPGRTGQSHGPPAGLCDAVHEAGRGCAAQAIPQQRTLQVGNDGVTACAVVSFAAFGHGYLVYV